MEVRPTPAGDRETARGGFLSERGKRGVTYVRSIRVGRWQVRRSALVAAALVVAVMFAGPLIASAQVQNPPMDPPTMSWGPAATVGVSWLPVSPLSGTTDTTYTLSYDTTYPFTATQTVVTTGLSTTIDGIDGVTYYAIIQADDGSGVLTDASAVSLVTADGITPVSSLVVSPAAPDGANGWYTSAGVSARISIEDTGSGLESVTVNGTDVSADVNFGLPPDPSSYTVSLTEGTNGFSFYGTDVAGNVESPARTASVKLDSVAPTCAIDVSASGPTSQSITVGIAAGDATPGSGVGSIQYAFLPRGTSPGIGTAWVSVAGSSVTTTAPEGRLTVYARSVDLAGNVSAVEHADVFFDATAPVTTLVTSPASPTGPSGSWLAAPKITLAVADADPNTITYYSWNDTGTIATVGNAPVVPTGSSVQTLRFFTVDTAGHREATRTVTFRVLIKTTLTISSSTSSVAHGHRVGFSGTISPNQPGGSHVGFYVKKPGSGKWVRVSTRSVYSRHHWSYSYVLKSRGTYSFQVRFTTTSKYAGSTSRTVKVRAR
jgi:hypothetical protein